MKSLPWIARAIGLLLLITFVAAPAGAQNYLVDDLGNVNPTSINSLGQVAGNLRMSDGASRAFLWADGQFKVLMPLSGDTDSEARGINDTGRVVGHSWRTPAVGTLPSYNGVLWAPTYTRRLTSAGGSSVALYDINNAGVIAGAVRRGESWQGILWTPEGVQEIPDIERAVAVNERNDIVGLRTVSRQYDLIQTWLWRDGAAIEIGPPGPPFGRELVAVAINTRGQLAVNVLEMHFPDSIVRWGEGGLTLPDLNGPGAGIPRWAMVKAINDAGDVVGWSRTPESGNHAFLYRDSTGTVDLNTKLPPDSGWVLESASAINDRGQIVGTGRYFGAERGFRLTPLWARPGFLRP